MSDSKEIELLIENNKLFIKGGINVISSLAGTGKTTYCLKVKDKLEKLGYRTLYMNADYAPTYGHKMYEPIGYQELVVSLMEEADAKDVIFIDSIKAQFTKDGISILDNSDSSLFMMELRAVTAKTGCTFILIHHSFKEKKLKNAEEHFYGSRAIEENCDSGFLFTQDSCTIVKNRAGLARGAKYETQV